MEHNSVWRPLTGLQKHGVELSIAQADGDGIVETESFARLIKRNTRLIVLLHASNVNGAIEPVAAVGKLAREHSIPFLVDASQSAGSIPIDVGAMNIDLLAFPGHKGLLGPPGTGGLYVSEEIALRPLKEGGTGSNSLQPDQPGDYPDRLESGTLNLPGIAGLNCAARYLLQKTVPAVVGCEALLTRRLLEGLAAIEGVTLCGPRPQTARAPVISFNLRSLDPVSVAQKLEARADIACRPGWQCAGLAHQTLGTVQSGTVRLSPGTFNSMREIETALAVIEQLARER